MSTGILKVFVSSTQVELSNEHTAITELVQADPFLSKHLKASSKFATYPQPWPAVSANLNEMRRMTISIMTAAINTMRTNINTTTKLINRRNACMTKRVYMQ